MTSSIADILFFLPFGLLIGVVVLEIVGGAQQSREVSSSITLLLLVTSVVALTAFLLGEEGARFWPLLLAIICGMAAALKFHCQKRVGSNVRKPVRKRRRARQSDWQRSIPTGLYFIFLISSIGILTAPLIIRTPTTAPSIAPTDRSLLEDHVDDDEFVMASESRSVALGEASDATSLEGESTESSDMSPEATETLDDENITAAEDTTLDDHPMEIEEPEVPHVVEAETSTPITPPLLPQRTSNSSAFNTYIVPIIQKNCVSCHGSDQQKGGLRLDSPEGIRKGGNSGAVVIAGQPDRSNLYTSVILPDGDPDLMPSKGDRLSARDTDLIMKWIRAGAEMGGGKGSTEIASSESRVRGVVDDATAQMLEASHILARAREGGALELDCSQVRNYGVAINWEVITNLGPRVTSLDLARSHFADSELQSLKSLTHLTHLDLSNTPVSDAAMGYLKDLAHLEVLNLYGTNVADSGLASLHGLKNLKKIFLWQSKVTPAGVEQLKRAIPGIDANLGT